MSLLVDPLDSLYNRNVSISANSLIPCHNYEIRLHFSHSLGSFRSYGIFKADGTGNIELEYSKPLRGTYSGVRPMGLFESLEPLSDFRKGGYLRFFGAELESLHYELFLYDSNGELLDSKRFRKRYQGTAVERTEIEDESGLRGVLFKPKGEGPFPTIMDVLGTGGGLSEHRAAALASEGFCVLVIAYFQYKDLTKNMHAVELDYFINAINWLSSRPYTSDKLGLHGSSFGGILVFLIAKICPQVHAVVSINPPHVMNNFAHIRNKGIPIPHAMVDPKQFVFRGDILFYDQAIRHLKVTKECDHHFEDIPKYCDVRFVVSMDDLSTSSIYSTRMLAETLKSSGHHVQYDCKPGGHVMEPPYYPFHAYFYSRLADGYMAYGGEASLHVASEVRVWKNTVDFFKKRITTERDTLSSKL